MTRVRAVLRLLGDLLITAGVIVGLFIGYELVVTDAVTNAQQKTLRHALEREWDTPQRAAGTAGVAPARLPQPALGAGVAILRVPRFGREYAEVVVEGVSVADLRRGPGHYPGTALPGRVGNFVVSGHRTTHGAPFRHVDQLRPGDPLVVETRAAWYVYRVTGHEIVPPDRIAVTAPVPEHPGRRPDRAVMTLTSCHPVYSARERYVVYAALAGSRPRAAGPPPELRG